MIEDIKERVNDKSKSYAMIAYFLLDKSSDSIEQLRIKDIEKHCHVSATTVIRFCKKVGMTGFSELKYRLVEDKKEENKIYEVNDSRFSKMADKYLEKIINAFTETKILLSENKLKYIIEFIKSANTISIYGVGSTYLIANDLEIKLEKLKKHCKAYNDNQLMRFSAKNADSNSLVIGITYSGLTSRVIDSLTIAKEQNAKTILLTSKKNIHFEDMFDVVVYISSSEIRDRVVNSTARLTMLYMIDLIYYSYINSNVEEFTETLMNSR